MMKKELSLEEYHLLVHELQATNEMPQRLEDEIIKISKYVTELLCARVRNSRGKYLTASEKDDCQQQMRQKLLVLLNDKDKSQGCTGIYPSRWLYTIALNEGKDFMKCFLADYERTIAFETVDVHMCIQPIFVEQIERELENKKFFRYLCNGLSTVWAQRFKITLEMLAAGATQEEIASFFRVKQPNIARWIKRIKEKRKKYESEMKSKIILIVMMLPFFSQLIRFVLLRRS